MRSIKEPILDPTETYTTCLEGVSDDALKTKYEEITNNIHSAADDYKNKVIQKKLFLTTKITAPNDTVVVGNVTKKELKNLYDSYMVSQKKPARKIYDELKSAAPRGKCPYCGFGHASTLDHYLPKSKYPLTSVLPINLVPSCKDCNTTKGNSFPSIQLEQTLHPYFDQGHFISSQWIFAEVMQTSPISIRYLVFPPDSWPLIDKERVRNHAKDYNLLDRFSVEAADEIPSIRDILLQHAKTLNASQIRQQLQSQEVANRNQHINSWKTALYQALAENTWYCEGGYKE